MTDLTARKPKKSGRDLDRELEPLLADPKRLGPNLPAVVQVLSTFLDGAGVTLYLFEEETNELTLRGTTQQMRGLEGLRLDAAGTLSALALDEHRVLALSESPGTPGARRAEEHVFPLEAAGARLGTVTVVSTSATRLSPLRLDMARRGIVRLAAALEKALCEEALLRRMGRLAAINEFGVILAAVRDPEEIPALATAMSTFVMGTEGAILRLWDEARGTHTVRDAYGLRDEAFRQDILRLEKLAAEEVLSAGSPLVVGDVASNDRYRDFSVPVRAFMTFPISPGESVVGTITTFNKSPESLLTPPRLGPEDQEVFTHFVRYLEKAISSAADFVKSRGLSDRDALTGLPDQSGFRAKLMAEISRARRFDLRIALVTCEVLARRPDGGAADGPVAAPVVRGIGDAIRGALREYDTVGRLGTQTFGVLLRQVRNGAIGAVSRIRAAVHRAVEGFRKTPEGAGLDVRVSHTVFPDSGLSGDDILEFMERTVS